MDDVMDCLLAGVTASSHVWVWAPLLCLQSNQVTGIFVAFKEAFLETDANKQLPHTLITRHQDNDAIMREEVTSFPTNLLNLLLNQPPVKLT